MANDREEQPKDPNSIFDERTDASEGDSELLEAVLHETLAGVNRESLDLIFSVARASKHEDTCRIEAVEEVVDAIVKHRFGGRRFSRSMIHRIANTLIETPESTVKLERLWQEARASG